MGYLDSEVGEIGEAAIFEYDLPVRSNTQRKHAMAWVKKSQREKLVFRWVAGTLIDYRQRLKENHRKLRDMHDPR